MAPCGIFDKKKFRAGINFIREIGLVPVLAPGLFKKDFIFAGTIKERVSSFMKMARRNDIKAMWCVRGGYGGYAVAQELAKFKAPRNPKVIIGHSDVFAIHMVCIQKWRWPGLHAPLVDRIGKDEVPSAEKKNIRQTLMNPEFRLTVNRHLRSMGKKTSVLGILTGGNLAMAASSLKTNWEIQTDGKILLLEDIGERAYRIDRMLFQLQAAGKLAKLKGVVIGDFTGCEEPDGKELWLKALERYFKKAPYPVIYGMKAGHGPLRLTLPLGTRVKIQGGGKSMFEVVESYACE